MPPAPAKGVATRSLTRHRAGQPVTPDTDAVAVEEPLEIRVDTEPLAVTMRTPGDDVRLSLGFLFAEGVITSATDVLTATHCGSPLDEGFGNTIDVTVAPHVARLKLSKRGTLTTAACGVCGRKGIEDLLARMGRVPDGPSLSPDLLARAPELLRTGQHNFAHTGGVHAAAITDESGQLLAFAEDVGRHNAVDKVTGALLQKGLLPVDTRTPGSPCLLVVSGRTSFEIVQKAATARLAAIASVSAGTSLAVDLAEASNLTLATFVRDGSCNVYTHGERLTSAARTATPTR